MAGDGDGGGLATERVLMAVQVSASGSQVREAALLGSQLGQFVGVGDAAFVDLADAPLLTGNGKLERSAAVGEGDADTVSGVGGDGVVPEELGGGDVGREEGVSQPKLSQNRPNTTV
jgi:hypothetical protein